MKLALTALAKAASGFCLLLLFLFLPAGTWHYPNAWLLLGILFIPMLFLGIFLLIKAPDVLQKRLDANEKDTAQKAVVLLSACGFVFGFVTAGLDYRFGWSHLPAAAVIVAAIVFLFGYGLYAEVCRENAFLSRTVRVEKGQTVVDTGMYRIVRHPMYMATLLMFLAMPIVLGSWVALLVFLFYPIVIAVRIVHEERLLCRELDGYTAYTKKVKYRLIPFVW